MLSVGNRAGTRNSLKDAVKMAEAVVRQLVADFQRTAVRMAQKGAGVTHLQGGYVGDQGGTHVFVEIAIQH